MIGRIPARPSNKESTNASIRSSSGCGDAADRNAMTHGERYQKSRRVTSHRPHALLLLLSKAALRARPASEGDLFAEIFQRSLVSRNR
jgi:hypothetical protein